MREIDADVCQYCGKGVVWGIGDIEHAYDCRVAVDERDRVRLEAEREALDAERDALRIANDSYTFLGIDGKATTGRALEDRAIAAEAAASASAARAAAAVRAVVRSYTTRRKKSLANWSQ